MILLQFLDDLRVQRQRIRWARPWPFTTWLRLLLAARGGSLLHAALRWPRLLHIEHDTLAVHGPDDQLARHLLRTASPHELPTLTPIIAALAGQPGLVAWTGSELRLQRDTIDTSGWRWSDLPPLAVPFGTPLALLLRLAVALSLLVLSTGRFAATLDAPLWALGVGLSSTPPPQRVHVLVISDDPAARQRSAAWLQAAEACAARGATAIALDHPLEDLDALPHHPTLLTVSRREGASAINGLFYAGSRPLPYVLSVALDDHLQVPTPGARGPLRPTLAAAVLAASGGARCFRYAGRPYSPFPVGHLPTPMTDRVDEACAPGHAVLMWVPPPVPDPLPAPGTEAYAALRLLPMPGPHGMQHLPLPQAEALLVNTMLAGTLALPLDAALALWLAPPATDAVAQNPACKQQIDVSPLLLLLGASLPLLIAALTRQALRRRLPPWAASLLPALAAPPLTLLAASAGLLLPCVGPASTALALWLLDLTRSAPHGEGGAP